MAQRFMETVLTPAVLSAQEHYYGRRARVGGAPANDALTDEEAQFIHERDSFYLGTVSETGWPYIQHRGGPAGFLRVLSPTRLAFPDFPGNRQLLSTGNVNAGGRVCLFLMDYPGRTRLKILGTARVEDAREHPEWVAQLALEEGVPTVERVFVIEVLSFDWNCPQYITPRYTAAEVERATAPLRERIAELERQLAERP